MICVSLAEKSYDQCLKLAKDLAMAEIRLDLLDFDNNQIQEIFAVNSNLIATYRPGKSTIEERLEKLKLAIQSGAGYVDIEYEAVESYRNQLIEFAKVSGCEIIISYHNFQGTPNVESLREIVLDCYNKGADIAKIACMVNDKIDNINILSLYNINNRLVAFGMGELGKISRVAAPLLGAEFTFATLPGEPPVAPGQLSINDLENIYKIIDTG